jgi:hypothetical protein
MAGPTGQKRLGHVNHCETLLLSRPPEKLKVTVG